MPERRYPATMIFLAVLILLAIAAAGIGGITLYVQNRAQTRTQAEAITGGTVAEAPHILRLMAAAVVTSYPVSTAPTAGSGPT